MKITMNPRTIAFIILSLLIVHRLAAQTLQLSFNARAIVQGRSAGVEARIGTNHDVWNFDGCLSVQFVKAVVEHLMQPDETRRFTDVTPYVELSCYRIVGVGLSPTTFRGSNAESRPEAILTLGAPINLWRNVDVFPRLQFQMPLQGGAFPLIFLGVGASYTL